MIRPEFSLDFPDSCQDAIAFGVHHGGASISGMINREAVTTPQEGLAFLTAHTLTALMALIGARLDSHVLTPARRTALMTMYLHELINHLIKLKGDLSMASAQTHDQASETCQ